MKLLEGKTALITGAARGIGKALAVKFAQEGANIAFTDLVIDENGIETEKEITIGNFSMNVEERTATLGGEEIPLTSRIVSVCADYVEQVVCKGQSPYLAVEALYGASGIYYDYNVVLAFVNNIPVYPLGELVRLSTKEVGIVSNIRKNEGPRPIVKVYFNRMNRPITEDKIIDLGVERTIFIEEIL